MTEQNLPELLPCPFCGGDAEFKPYKKDGLTIKCKSLGCVRRDQRVLRHSIDWLGEVMAKDWNTRAAIEQSRSVAPPALYQHDDGRYALAMSDVARHRLIDGDPAWHRVPLDVVVASTQAAPAPDAPAPDAAGGGS